MGLALLITILPSAQGEEKKTVENIAVNLHLTEWDIGARAVPASGLTEWDSGAKDRATHPN